MESAVLFANKLELRYYFNDKSVYMDAVVRNKCEREMLQLIRFVAGILDVKMMIYSEPSVKEGGYSERWAIAGRNPRAHSVVLNLAMYLMTHPLLAIDGSTTTLPYNGDQLRDDIRQLQRQLPDRKRAVILPPDLVKQLDTFPRVRRCKAAFYEALKSYPKVVRIVFRELNENNRNRSGSLEVRRERFSQFIVEVVDAADERQVAFDRQQLSFDFSGD